MKPQPFLPRVQQSIEEYGLLPPGARPLVACSGGGDSMALLHALLRLGYPIAVAHMDHAARDNSADDAAFVSAAADALTLPCKVVRHPVAEEARERGLSFEAHARTVRYAFLAEAAKEFGCTHIATGHTASDQAETLLMRIIRGAGPAGLAGIPIKGEHHGLPVVRPLLEISRDEVRAWLREEGIEWREDPTNAEPHALRNRVRNELLPLVRDEYNPRVEEALCRLAAVMQVEEAWQREAAHKASDGVISDNGQVSRAAFVALPEAVQQRVVMTWLVMLNGLSSDAKEIREVRDFIVTAATGERFSLQGALLIYAGSEYVEPVQAEEPEDLVVAVPFPGEILWHGWKIDTRVMDTPVDPIRDCNQYKQYLAADSLGGSIELRTRRHGDRMTPLGAPGSRLLSDIMVDRKIPAPQRSWLPLVTNGVEILWFPGGPVAQSAAITPDTKQAIEIVVTPCT